MMTSGRNSLQSRCPFTVSQWQELEHQALIFKYMASGIPIPSDLILPIRRSFLLDSTATSRSLSFTPQPQWGWSSTFPAGFGRKAEDPEPGRCRRTDGKKWRCSKEAYPDSKYCERHMHRGKNRSRKPVEISLATKSNHFTSSSSPSPSSSTPSPFPAASLSISTPEPYPLLYHNHHHHHHHHPSAYSSRPPGTGTTFSSTDFLASSSQLQLDSGLTYPDGDYRLGQGSMRGFLCDAPGVDWDTPSPPFKSVALNNNPGETKQSGYSLSKEEEEERQRPLRHFFDEWPQRNRDPWMNMDDENGSCTKTRLSIAFPK